MAPRDPHAVPTLRDLIQRHMDRTGQSQRALAGRSGVKHQTLSTWFAGTIAAFPDPATLRKFAAYTGYSEHTVVLAAGRTIGMRMADAGGPLVNSLPPGTDNLVPEDIDAIRAIVCRLVDARRQVPGPDWPHVQGIRLMEDPSLDPSYDRNGRG